MAMQLPPGPLSGPSRARNRRRNPIWRFRRFFFVIGVIAIVALGSVWGFVSRVELQEDDFEQLIETTYICTGEVQRDCGPDNAANELALAGEDRVVIGYQQMPPVLIQAVVATEDQNFFEHNGVDATGVLRATFQTLRRVITDEGSLQGGSTITQQYIDLITPEVEGADARGANFDTITGNLKEMVQAIKLEQQLVEDLGSEDAAKQQVLERYLNRAYFGRGAYGVQAASQSYFSKNVDELTLPEAAYLAGLLRNPNNGDASERLDEGTRRRAETLREMMEQGYIIPEDQAAADADTWPNLVPEQRSEVGIGDVKGSEYGTEYFVAAVRSQLDELYPNGEYYTQSLRVYTTLDPDRQRLAYETITNRIDPNNPDMPLGGLITVDANGEVVAMMGGANWEQSQVNLTLGRDGGGSGFQPGSLMKTFALAEFIEQGYSPESYFSAPTRTTFERQSGFDPWPVRGGARSSAPDHRSVYVATQYSMNTVYAQMMYLVGPEQVIDIARRLGIESEMLAVPSLVLGSEEMSMLEMTAAYANLAREGVRLDPVFIERIEDAEGNILCWYPTERCEGGEDGRIRQGTQAINPSVARQVNLALANVMAGTGRNARILDAEGETLRATAGKTGTTQNNRDAWFAGFTCGMTTAVWMGYPGVAGEPPRYMNDLRNAEIAEEFGLEAPLLPSMTELFNDEAGDYVSSGGNGRINGGDIPAELWGEYMTAATASAPPCEELPTERAGAAQRVIGQELLTTLAPCAEPDPALVAAQTTTQPEQPAEGGGDGGDENAFAPPTAAGRVENVGLRFAPIPAQNPAQNEEQPNTTAGFTPTTEPCLPVDLDGRVIETTETTANPAGPSSSDPNASSTETTDPNNPSTETTDPNNPSTETTDTTAPPNTQTETSGGVNDRGNGNGNGNNGNGNGNGNGG